MRRSATANHDSDHNHSSTTTIINETSVHNNNNHHPPKRSLEDYGFQSNFKRRRHLSPQNGNIDINNANDSISLTPMKKKTRTKSKTQSVLNSSLEANYERNSINDIQTPRKTSSRHAISSQQMTEISLPNWQNMCPNIDQILSNKHTQSGVFAHEVQLVQQELEALLSMSIVRENILRDLCNPPANNSDTVRSKIRKHQEAERVYSSKKLVKKPLPSLTNSHHHHHHQRQNATHVLLDRQVAMQPILGARIDQIWSDINTYYRKISSNDISTIENLVTYHQHLEKKFEEIKLNYNEQSKLIEKLTEENYQQLIEFSQVNPLVTHYVDRTTLGSFQSKIYEHMGRTSPVYRTPISSPLHGKALSNHFDVKDINAALRISSRLHSNEISNARTGLFSLPDIKVEEDAEASVLPLKSKKKSKLISHPSSAMKFQQQLELVQDYLIDQHPNPTETAKRQLFHEMKSTKKRKTSLSTPTPMIINNVEHCTDIFQSKLSMSVDLLHECSIISSCALKRARLLSDNEQTWQKLTAIERDLEALITKLNVTGGYANSSSTEKAFQNLAQLLSDWQKYEEEFDQQLEELVCIDQS
ncbi:unnamed protein product [Adineta ricciae]|uniref:Uncharacterized protein n=1 Tax=Adineta ricciae TaxID=249248 RepID=A0A814HT69_ADIRI|nr:unnamed protein product [Adineta ricciae]CAF1634969.1 unnamed protein product [Adineta ricciae]